MPKYIVRVELQNAVPEDYKRLTALMGSIGFATLVTANDGHSYQLPIGEYIKIDVRDSPSLLSMLKSGILANFIDAAILVVDYDSIAWHLSRIE